MKKLLASVLAVVLALSLAACGGNDKQQKNMANAIVKASQEALKDETLYYNNLLVFTPGEDKQTYVMIGLCYMKDGAVQEDTALGIFSGDSMDEFALKEVDSEEYGKLLDTMPVNNKEKYASKSLVEEVCTDNDLGTYEQAQKDLGI